MTTDAIEATDAAIAKANALGVDLDEVEGTGQEGRITVADVELAAGPDAAEEPAGETVTEEEAEGKSPADLMPDRAHLEGCPLNPARVEAYPETVPAKTDSAGAIIKPPRAVTMLHCVDCGQTYQLERAAD